MRALRRRQTARPHRASFSSRYQRSASLKNVFEAADRSRAKPVLHDKAQVSRAQVAMELPFWDIAEEDDFKEPVVILHSTLFQ